MLEPPAFSKDGIVANPVSVALKAATIWVIDLYASRESVPRYWDILAPDEKERANLFRFSDVGMTWRIHIHRVISITYFATRGRNVFKCR